jgi:hypothetical protein
VEGSCAELEACRTREHRGADRTREDLEVTNAEPVKWERAKGAAQVTTRERHTGDTGARAARDGMHRS